MLVGKEDSMPEFSLPKPTSDLLKEDWEKILSLKFQKRNRWVLEQFKRHNNKPLSRIFLSEAARGDGVACWLNAYQLNGSFRRHELPYRFVVVEKSSEALTKYQLFRFPEL